MLFVLEYITYLGPSIHVIRRIDVQLTHNVHKLVTFLVSILQYSSQISFRIFSNGSVLFASRNQQKKIKGCVQKVPERPEARRCIGMSRVQHSPGNGHKKIRNSDIWHHLE